ncbi:hypothetical protein GDO78_019643 [Eleutherodactylus coqui]|uniref:Uncharacterized protein n=1 Tax=Eleutherodactylus coqui TaxID=57060 RepID=A0A8J6EIZ4_ELECQ|nr:hypothetical protein GDO78_019643 [Eleutherodactylus coqui]
MENIYRTNVNYRVCRQKAAAESPKRSKVYCTQNKIRKLLFRLRKTSVKLFVLKCIIRVSPRMGTALGHTWGSHGLEGAVPGPHVGQSMDHT